MIINPTQLSLAAFLLLSVASVPVPLFAEEQVYKGVDEDGVPVFTDQALPGSESIKVREPTTFSDPALQRRQLESRKEEAEDTTSIVSYSVVITDPPNDSAIRNNAGNLTLTIAIAPALLPAHNAELIMDGQKVRNVRSSGTVDLVNVDRGTHVFHIRVVDQGGKVITDGPPTSVSVLRYHRKPG